ncbi:ADP-ribosylhydrolase ARH1-like isoform X2 [Synchiropus splendidus]|uniref:ADP-ribosylhydrolase ARH1-like isoform X2 n=1 Tax=Synchiropus splendidus TaxID=270530 RepID=UPI00237D60B7|nr:ADP-ribosylhydrolase ARH1-like isoform X2 [Synchiropus splendidus]
MDCMASLDHYKAGMVLSGVGDALGFRNEMWEFNKSGPAIHKELQQLGGLKNIKVKLPDWPVSDDTVLHLATAEGLATGKAGEDLLHEVAARYMEAMKDMEGRAPGRACSLGISRLRPGEEGGFRVPYNPRGTGCGAAMRSMCIGLRYLDSRGISNGVGPVSWPESYGPAERDMVYSTYSLFGWAGDSGHDAPMIALDALLGAGSDWEELMSRAAFHGGDSDSTAVIAACCWGLLYGTKGVPKGNFSSVEYRERLERCAEQLYVLSH